ncbi:histidine ammonia-lyase [Idiomarina tyrosinivorans]|uniref:tyrosine ammonia-lyase n=1 Tax=Idiomarina tyrosinivorans TaxID=1445662 RepID=A0A432ZS38_9GAMM|nr:aromatic amino acid ammonia-lyase [Idiomarina tyrosinivorans]RUO80734.1 histidine ammonia-lyase [Idiomarina tyrosinivorans]
MTTCTILFNGQPLGFEWIAKISRGDCGVRLSEADAFVEHIEAGAKRVDEVLEQEGKIYGITTGYGDSCNVGVAAEHVHQLPINLTRFHGCGLGDYLTEAETRAVLAVRLQSLCQGYSGVSYGLLQRLTAMLQHDILPLIPAEGSVGASGDLTPLSYVAGAIIGERDVRYNGTIVNAADAFKDIGLAPYTLRPKEALALMNGTAVMTALACLNLDRAQYLARLSTRISSLMVIAANGNPYHYDAELFTVKPHKGQQLIAQSIRTDLGNADSAPTQTRLQDRYSLRCAPHIIGALEDSFGFISETVNNELNSANDNPIVNAESGRIHHGGHFYGGHIAMVMDLLKTQVANLADLHDRQVALVLDATANQGLPANLSAAQGDDRALHHGFKAVQIGCSAWTAEALKHTMPASVFSRSTECHNQDKVSMGTIAARDARRVLELTEQAASAALLIATHGAKMRGNYVTATIAEFVDELVAEHPLLTEDRPLEPALRQLLTDIRQQRWALAL